MPPTKKPRLGEMLVDAKVISQPQLEEALRTQRVYGGKLGTNLVELGYVDDAFLSHFLSEKLGIRAVSMEQLENIPLDVVETVPKELADKFKVVPFRLEKKYLDVAMVDPTDLASLDELSFATGLQLRPHVATEVVIVYALERHYGIPKDQRYARLSPDKGSHAKPAAATGPQRLTLQDCIQALFNVEDKDQIIEVLIRFAQTIFPKVVVLILKTNYLQGYAAAGPDWLKQRASTIRVSLQEPNIFQQVFESHQHWLGVPPALPGNQAVLSWMGEDPTAPVFVAPLVFQNRAELLVYGSPVDKTFTEPELQRFLVLMEKATLAVHLMVLKRRMRVLPEGLN